MAKKRKNKSKSNQSKATAVGATAPAAEKKSSSPKEVPPKDIKDENEENSDSEIADSKFSESKVDCKEGKEGKASSKMSKLGSTKGVEDDEDEKKEDIAAPKSDDESDEKETDAPTAVSQTSPLFDLTPHQQQQQQQDKDSEAEVSELKTTDVAEATCIQESVLVKVEESLSMDGEEGYVEVTHLDTEEGQGKQNPACDFPPLATEESRESRSPLPSAEISALAEVVDDDDAIFEGILSGSDELSAKYRLHSEASYPYPDAPPSTPSEGSLPPLHPFDPATLSSSLEEGDERDVEEEESEQQGEAESKEPPRIPSPPSLPSPPLLAASATAIAKMKEEPGPVSKPPTPPPVERSSSPTPNPSLSSSVSPVEEAETDPEEVPPPAVNFKANPLSSTRSSSDPLSTSTKDSSSSQRRPSFKDTAEYSFMESLSPSPQPAAASPSSPSTSSSTPPVSAQRAPSPLPAPTPVVERRVLIALTLRVLFELRLRRILDQETVGKVKEQLFDESSSSSGLTESAEEFLRTRDMDPLLSAILLAGGLEM